MNVTMQVDAMLAEGFVSAMVKVLVGGEGIGERGRWRWVLMVGKGRKIGRMFVYFIWIWAWLELAVICRNRAGFGCCSSGEKVSVFAALLSI